MSEKSLYGVKIMFTHSVNEKIFYEETVLSVRACSFDDAYEKAEKYAKESSDEHINPKGETVRTEKYELLDCFLAFDEEDDVREIYSKFSVNRSSLSEDEYYKTITDQCGEKELFDLRYL